MKIKEIFKFATLLAVGSLTLGARANCQLNSLRDGRYSFAEQDKIRAKVVVKTTEEAGKFQLQVSRADDISSFQNGSYTLVLKDSSDQNAFPCVIEVLNSKGQSIVPLSNPELPMTAKFSSHASLGTNSDGTEALNIETSGFTGCGGEGTPPGCPPEEAQLIRD